MYMYMYVYMLCTCVLLYCFIEDGAARTDLLSSLDNDDPVARALFKMIDEKVLSRREIEKNEEWRMGEWGTGGESEE